MAANPNAAVGVTRRYLAFLREQMAGAVADFVPFNEACEAIDWSEFQDLPALPEANRRNACQVCLSMEAEALGN